MAHVDSSRADRHRTHPVLLLSLALLLTACAGDQEGVPEPATVSETRADSAPASIGDVGFMTPESVWHDVAADVYLVSNINGAPAEKDNNGFISRVSPDGQLTELRWIAGGTGGVTLHAPKGLAVRGDSLFAADLDTVRIFDRETGEPLGGWGVPGATLLNDLAVGSDGTIYVTDTGMRGAAGGALEPSGTDAVYRFGPDGQPESISTGTELSNPNGIVATDDGVIFVPFGSNVVSRIDAAGQLSSVAELPAGQVDGVVRLEDGTLLVTSWEGSAVYRISSDGQVSTELENVDAPADLGYDASRGRIVVPLFNENRLVLHPVR